MIRDMPADRIIVETDCPYLAPVPHARAGATSRPMSAACAGQAGRDPRLDAWRRPRQRTDGRLLRPVRPDPAAMSGRAGDHHPGLRLVRRRAARPTATGASAIRPSRRTAARRCSLLVRREATAPSGETTVLIDTSPDLRDADAAAAGVKRVDAVLYTHDHADQTHGIDDLRVFVIRSAQRIPAWMDAATARRADAAVRLHLREPGRLSGHLRPHDHPAARPGLGGRRAVAARSRS